MARVLPETDLAERLGRPGGHHSLPGPGGADPPRGCRPREGGGPGSRPAVTGPGAPCCAPHWAWVTFLTRGCPPYRGVRAAHFPPATGIVLGPRRVGWIDLVPAGTRAIDEHAGWPASSSRSGGPAPAHGRRPSTLHGRGRPATDCSRCSSRTGLITFGGPHGGGFRGARFWQAGEHEVGPLVPASLLGIPASPPTPAGPPASRPVVPGTAVPAPGPRWLAAGAPGAPGSRSFHPGGCQHPSRRCPRGGFAAVAAGTGPPRPSGSWSPGVGRGAPRWAPWAWAPPGAGLPAPVRVLAGLDLGWATLGHASTASARLVISGRHWPGPPWPPAYARPSGRPVRSGGRPADMGSAPTTRANQVLVGPAGPRLPRATRNGRPRPTRPLTAHPGQRTCSAPRSGVLLTARPTPQSPPPN